MDNGMNPVVRILLITLVTLALAPAAMAEIYKVVNPDGSITYTDQRPASGAEPVDLPPLSVVETDIDTSAITDRAAAAEAKEPTLRDLRRQFGDFRITQPQPEETFWGTGNTVTVAWGASQPLPEGFDVSLYVDGARMAAPDGGSTTLTLDRGEHTVYAELRDSRRRLITTTPTVTFFIKQYSENFGQPRPTPRGG